MQDIPDKGLIHLSSEHPFSDTLQKLVNAIERRGISISARIDHSAAALQVGLTLPPTVLFIFGNPLLGTPLMVASPSVAIDLPLKVLVWQDAEASIWITYNSLDYLQQRHSLPRFLMSNLAALESIVKKLRVKPDMRTGPMLLLRSRKTMEGLTL